MTLLHHVDPARRMWRFYRVRLAADLFGQTTVLREWGSIGSPGKVRVDVMMDAAAAEAWHARLLRGKLRKGYTEL